MTGKTGKTSKKTQEIILEKKLVKEMKQKIKSK